jgi:hypothetical protein
MKMVAPSTTTKADLSGRLFVFGSWLSSQTPKDLDLVFVYDQSICSPQDAISVRRALIRCGARLGLPPIHVVLLSETESSQCRFIELEGAILLQKWADERCDDLLRRLISETEHFL